MEKKYSAVFYSKDVVVSVKILKDLLKSKIEWYNSCNSEAHITIFELTIEESYVGLIKQQLVKICDTFTPFQVHLNHFGTFPPVGAYYIAPSETSEKDLKIIMEKTHNAMRGFKIEKITKPHLSIGRRLSPENLKIASELLTTIDLKFICDQIVLREYDPKKGQYFIIDAFTFGNNPQPELVQGSLF